MRTLTILLTSALMIFLAPYALADEEIRLFIEATIGVNVSAPATAELDLGEKGGFFITIINEGNVRDKIRLEGQLNPPTDWIEFAFICGSTTGQCDSVPSSQLKLVDEIQLTPEIRETEVFVEMTGWRKTSTYSPANRPNLRITGYSLTNRTKQGLADIPIVIEDPDAGFGPLASPDMTGTTFLIMFLTATAIAVVRKDVL